MMTRKDYVATAEILNKAYLNLPISTQEIFLELVEDFGKMFAEDNPRFDARRFVNACYQEED